MNYQATHMKIGMRHVAASTSRFENKKLFIFELFSETQRGNDMVSWDLLWAPWELGVCV